MSIPIYSPIDLNSEYANLDSRYVDSNGNPFVSKEAAENALNRRLNKNHVGLTILVQTQGEQAKEYWVQPVIENGETIYRLVKKGSSDYTDLSNKPAINGVTLMGDNTPAQLGLATANQVETLSDKVDNLPTGYYYGKFSSVEDLPESTEKGYAYVASSDPTVFYTYLVSGAGAEWVDSGNKMVNTVDLTTPKTAGTELSKGEKYYASANVNDRPADVVIETGVVNALGYKVLDPRKRFAEQVSEANTIYEIKDSFDLGGESVTVPANCTLRFNGGKLSNGTIIGNNTTIDTTDGIIFSGISLLGTWRNTDFYTDWWKMFADGESDDSLVLTSIGNTINANGQGNIIFGKNKVYGVAFHSYVNPGAGEELPYVIKLINVNNVVVDLNGSSLKVIHTDEVLSKTIGGETKTFTNDQIQGYSVIASHGSNVIIKDGTIEGDRITHDYNAPAPKYQNNNWTWAVKGSNEWGYGVYGIGGTLELDKVVISNMTGDSVFIKDYYLNGELIKKINFSAFSCELHHNRRQGVSASCAESIKIKDCNIHHIGSYDSIDGASPKSGIDLENDPNRVFGEVLIQGTVISNCDGGSIIYGSPSSQADKIIIDGCNIDSEIVMLYPSELRTVITNSTINGARLKYVDINNCTLNLVVDSFFGDVKITNSNINYIDSNVDLWVIGNVEFEKCTINGIYQDNAADVNISSYVETSPQVNEYEVHFTDCYINSLAFGNEYSGRHVLRYYITNSTLNECQLYTTPLSLHDFPYTYININNCQLINSVQYIATACPMVISSSNIVFEYQSKMGSRHWLGENATINDSVINVNQTLQPISAWNDYKARFTAKNTIAKIIYPSTSTWRDQLQNVNVEDSQINVMRGTVPLTLDTFAGVQKNTVFNKGIAIMSHPPLGEGNIGYMQFNSTLNKPIFWTGNAWVDSNSDYIVDNSGSLQNRLALTSPVKGQQFKLTGGANDIYLIYVSYGWFKATDGTPWYDDSGTLNAMYDKYNYTLLTAEPSDWATKYNTYYKVVNGVYTLLTTAETWTADTYYKKDVNAYKGIQVKLTTDTDTELLNKVVKWDGTKYINIVDNVALKAGTPKVTFTTGNNTTTATITSTSSGKIYYTKDGNDPTSSSTEYSSAITLADGDQVKAICIRDHMDNSAPGFVPVSVPVITFSSAGILTITCETPNAKIYYTIDGNNPSTSSTEYDSSASVTIAKGVTVKAFAVLIGLVNSAVASKKRS